MTKTTTKAAYYGNLARVAIEFAIQHNSLVEQHAAVIYARAAAHEAHRATEAQLRKAWNADTRKSNGLLPRAKAVR